MGDHAGSEHFQTTHWSMVQRAGYADAAARREALTALLRQYLPALRAHLVRRKRVREDRAADLLQGFIASKVLEDGILSQADRTRGKFRTFLLTALDRYGIDQSRRDSAQKRNPGAAGGGTAVDAERSPARSSGPVLSAEEAADAGAGALQPAPDAFELEWARQLLKQTLSRMEQECVATGKSNLWRLFEDRVLGAIVGDAEPTPYEKLAVDLGFGTAERAANMLITAKRMYERFLRQTIGEYALTEEEIDEEIRDLYEILARGAGSRPR